jgi:hypothetical protein
MMWLLPKNIREHSYTLGSPPNLAEPISNKPPDQRLVKKKDRAKLFKIWF